MTGTGAAGAVATVSWTLRCAVGAGGRRVLPRRVDGVVRGGRGRRLRVRPGPERAAEAGARAAAVALAQPGAGQRAGVAAVPRFPLSDAGELEPQAAGGGQGGVAAGRGARGQPALRGDQPRVGRIGTQPLYEQLYCARGDMENRIKEQQLDLFADRTSAATRRANQLRLYWALFAAALLEVAAVVRVSVRRVWVSLSSVFPRQELFAHSLARLRAETPG